MTPEQKTQMIEHNKAHLCYLHMNYTQKLHLIGEFSKEFPILRPIEVNLVEFIKIKGLTELKAC